MTCKRIVGWVLAPVFELSIQFKRCVVHVLAANCVKRLTISAGSDPSGKGGCDHPPYERI